MKNFLLKAFNYIVKIESKIAFYPTIFSLGGFVFAFIMFYLENQGISDYLSKHAPVLVVKDTDTARSLLTTFVAGLISIMVFSFSMVMILLNQASSNFSPRVLPGLISNRRHQIILGIYNASLLYCIFTLVGIEPSGESYQLPGFSVLIAIFYMTVCLGAFIYFIHSISQEIQVNNIMSRIFTTAKDRMDDLIQNQTKDVIDFPDTNGWKTLNSMESGYLQNIAINNIASIATENNFQLEIMPVKGTYLLHDTPLVKFNCELKKELKENLLSSFLYSKGERVEDNYILAFKQLTEIAVKAMSPGINDPGTALNAIDYLTELFLIRLQKRDDAFSLNENNNAILRINTICFEELLYNVMAALRTYCKQDVIIVQKLFQMFSILLNSNNIIEHKYTETIKIEAENLYNDVSNSLTNTGDIDRISGLYKTMKADSF